MSPVIVNNLSIKHDEQTGSPTETFTGDGVFQAVRKVKCVWADRMTLATELKGSTKISQAGGITILLPHAYPGFTAALCTGVSIKGFGVGAAADPPTNRVIKYNHAILTVTYSTATIVAPEIAENVIIVESLEPSAEFLTMPTDKLFWDKAATQPLTLDEAPAVLFVKTDWVFTIMEMDTSPAPLFDLVGATNDKAVRSQTLNVTFPFETLLVQSMEPSRIITTAGKQAWRVTFRFTYSAGGWNNFYKSGDDTRSPIYNAAGVDIVFIANADLTRIPGIVSG